MVQPQYERVEGRFTWTAIAEATLAFYAKTLARPPRL